MSRNSSGTYTLPELPFVDGTVIQATPVNNDFSDIATALTQSLATTGVSTMTGPIKAANGAVDAPSYTFANSLGTGFYRIGSDIIGYAVNSVLAITFNGDRSVNFANSLRVGNSDITDGNYLDWYQEGTFTLELTFGGATTGITYAGRSANYTRIGNIVFVNFSFTLSSKGSATGSAAVRGLPFTSASNNFTTLSMSVSSMNLAGEEYIFGVVGAGSVQVGLFQINAGSTVSFLDITFNNNSFVNITGFYRV